MNRTGHRAGHAVIIPDEQPAARATVDPVIKAITAINATGLFVLFAWLVLLSFHTGEKSQQIEMNSAQIKSIQDNGSTGTHARLDRIEAALADLREGQMVLTQQIFDILHGTSLNAPQKHR